MFTFNVNATIRVENAKSDEILAKLNELVALQTGEAQAQIDALAAQLKANNTRLAAAVDAISLKE